MNTKVKLTKDAESASGAQGKTEDLDPGAVSIRSVSKSFRKHTVVKNSYSTVKEGLIKRLFFREKKENLLHALKDFNLEIEPGFALGVIGRNGSGKSTLLKLIAGIYHPDSGLVKTKGRISALIELGAGFHPDFSGRENIYLGGIMYGLSKKQIEQKFDAIVAYAQLEDFIDDPVKTYSSGMYMRLGFSLAIHTDPDILLIDEVLAVGDAAFIHRCEDTISEFKRQGKTLIFVTHDLGSVEKWCDKAVYLDKGVVRESGEPRRVIDAYLSQIERVEEGQLEVKNEQDEGDDSKNRWGNREVEITDVRMLDKAGSKQWLFHEEDEITIEVDYKVNKEVQDLVFGVGIIRVDGLNVHATNTDIEDCEVKLDSEKGTYRYKIKRIGLVADSYYLDVAAHKKDGTPYDYHHLMYKFSIRNDNSYQGVFVPQHEWDVG